MDRLIALLSGQDDTVELDRAALELATIEDPALDVEASLQTLDEWAAEINRRLPPAAGGAQYLSVAHQFLFKDLGIRGDTDDYFHPRNSCISHVLRERRGLPITLSVVYMEVARRCLRPVYGIGLPAHFVALYNDGLISVYVDPFHGGRLLSRQDCDKIVRQATGQDISGRDILFTPAGKRDILSRIGNNLRKAYYQSSEWAKLVKVITLLLHSQTDTRAQSELAKELHFLRSHAV